MQKSLILTAHILFWVLSFFLVSRLFGIETIEILETNTESKEVITYDNFFIYATLVCFIAAMLLFYTHLIILLPAYFRNKKTGRYIVGLLLVFTITFLINCFINTWLIYERPPGIATFFYPSLGLHFIIFIFFLVISFSYAFILEWYKNEQLKSQLQKEKLNTELNFLKSQINPHFLFNTLNNLYATAQKHGVDELATGIEDLSGLMRYMLYESNASYVPLAKEIQQLENYIEIRKMSIGEEDEFILNFEKSGNFKGVRIAPLILLPFVENAFKHGISQNESSLISISIFSSRDEVNFKVANRIFREERVKDNAAGIGLDNVKRRLILIYPNRHKLNITEKDKLYTVDLNIKMHG